MKTTRVVVCVLAILGASTRTPAEQGERAHFSLAELGLALSRPEMHVSGAAMAHMIEGVGAPDATVDTVSIRWPDGTIELPGGDSVPISLELGFKPGAGFPLDDGTHLVMLEDLAGELAVAPGESAVRWRVEPGNYGVFVAKSQYNPAGAEHPFGLHLPVLLRNEKTGVEVGVHLLLAFRYDARARALTWNAGSINPLIGESPAARHSSVDMLVAAFTSTTAPAPPAESGGHEPPLRIRANHATTPARFKYGDGLERLISAAPDALPKCTDDPDELDVEFLGATDDDRLAVIRLELMPGPSWESEGGVRNVLMAFGGLLTLGETPSA